MSDRATTPSCIFVGATPLLVACASQAREAGWDVHAIVSDDDGVRAWAAGHDIPRVTWGDLETREDVRADCLFSVVNHRILRKSILQRFCWGANFHDAILPGHRGVNCAAWALATGDGSCGATWHVLTDEVDGGAVLRQGRFRVRGDDSAFSLSARCAELAAELFAPLLVMAGDPSAETVPRAITVDPGPLHLKRDAPPNAGVLLWTEPAWRLCRLVRATDSGSAPNTFGSAVMVLPEGLFYVVDAVDRMHSGQERNHQPGTVLSSDANEVAIVCGDGDILVVRELANGRGAAVSPVTLHSLRAGRKLRVVPDAEIQLARGLIATTQRGEVGTARLIRAGGSELRTTAGTPVVQSGRTDALRGRRSAAVAAAVLVLGMLAGDGPTRFALRQPGRLPTLDAPWLDFVSPTVPIQIDTCSEPRAVVRSCSELLDSPEPFIRSDLGLRYGGRLRPRWDFAVASRDRVVPAVGFEATAAMPAEWPMTVVLADREPAEVQPVPGAEAIFVVGGGGELGWTVASATDIAELVRIAIDRLAVV